MGDYQMTDDAMKGRQTEPPDDIEAWFQRELDRRLDMLLSQRGDVYPTSSFSPLDYMLMVLMGLVVPMLALYMAWR
jgi:hypothetical protein